MVFPIKKNDVPQRSLNSVSCTTNAMDCPCPNWTSHRLFVTWQWAGQRHRQHGRDARCEGLLAASTTGAWKAATRYVHLIEWHRFYKIHDNKFIIYHHIWAIHNNIEHERWPIRSGYFVDIIWPLSVKKRQTNVLTNGWTSIYYMAVKILRSNGGKLLFSSVKLDGVAIKHQRNKITVHLWYRFCIQWELQSFPTTSKVLHCFAFFAHKCYTEIYRRYLNQPFVSPSWSMWNSSCSW